MTETVKEFEAINEALIIAREHNLEAEVLAFAFQAQRDSPHYTTAEALAVGLAEWDV